MSNFPLINPLPTPVEYSTQPPQAASIDQTSGLSGKVDTAAVPRINVSTIDETSPALDRLQRRQASVKYEPPKKRFRNILESVFVTSTDPEAILELGVCYQLGNGVKRDLSVAEMLFRKAANLKHPEGIRMLGVCYQNGWGVAKDPVEAVKLFTQASSLNNLDALCSLGLCLLHGEGIPKNVSEAVSLFRKAVDCDNPMGMTCFGWCYENGLGTEKNPTEAVSLYKRAAKCDCPDAMYNLALCYARGNGIEVDPKAAVELYTRAATFHHADAINNLAMCYVNGWVVEKNQFEAIRLFQKGEKLDHANSTYNLALCYLYEKEKKEFVDRLSPIKIDAEIGRLLVKAVDLNHIDTIIALGDYYGLTHSDTTLEDRRFGVDFENIWNLDKNHLLYKNNIINIPSTSLSTRSAPFSIETVMNVYPYWGSTAEDAGRMCRIYYSMDFYCLYSKMVEKELREPLTRPQLYKKAADIIASNQNNDSEAIFSYGLCYATGDGVERNSYVAAQLFKRAAELNHADATYELGKCYENGYGVKQNSTKANNLFKKAADLKTDQLIDQPAKIFALGKQYASGIGGEQNKIMVAHLYKKAADIIISDQRNDPADAEVALELGKCYENGYGVKQDSTKANNLFKRAADLKAAQLLDQPAKILALGKQYASGIDVEQNKIMVAHLYKKAADIMLSDQRNDPVDIEVALQLGACYENGYIDKEKKVPVGEFLFSLHYMNTALLHERDLGACVERNVAQAVILFKKAADLMANQLLDQPDKIVSLGESYVKDVEIMQNKSDVWRDLDAIERMLDYHHPMYEPQNETVACQLFLRAAELNHPEALFNLSICHLLGVGVDKNMPYALDLLQKAVRLRHPGAMTKLAILLIVGAVVPNDTQTAFTLAPDVANLEDAVPFAIQNGLDLLRKAVELGNPEAMTKLALLMIEGKVVPKDEQAAFTLVKNASDLGDAEAFAIQSNFHSTGNVVQRDVRYAKRLMQRARDLS